MIVSIKSLTYSTPDGQKIWGEESSSEIIDRSYQITVQRQENIEIQKQRASDFENEEHATYEPFETDLCGESQIDTDHKGKAELASIKRHLDNIHIKENVPPIYSSATPVKNKCRVEVDLLLEDGSSSIPKVLTVARTKARDDHQWLPLQELGNDSLSGHPDVVPRKQVLTTNVHSSLLCHQPFNSHAPHLANGTMVPRNPFLWSNNETGFSSFLEMYESADEHCSWNNVTIADLYPKMVKTLSRLLHKASSSSLIRWNKYGYWHPKKTKLNTSKERIRNFRSLNVKSILTMTDDNQKKHKLSMTNMRNNSSFDGDELQTEYSVNNVTSVVSSVNCDTDNMEVNSSGIVKYHSFDEKVGQNSLETTTFHSIVSSDETFLVRSPTCTPLSSDCVENSHTFEESFSPMDTADSGAVFNLTVEEKCGEMDTVAFKAASCLNVPLNSSTNSYLQNKKLSPVKTSNTLLENHETKMFNNAILLQRSYSLSSLPVNQSPMKVHQKCEDAFEKMYKELCSPVLQKSFKFSNMCTSPQKSTKLCTSSFNGVSSRYQKCNSTFDSIYQQLCSEGFPKSPTFLRAASLKRKYEGVHMSETVNALVNSPVRTLPVVSRIKGAASFFSEDSRCSPIKRFKNLSENYYRVHEKLPSWKNNLQKTDMTFTLYTPNVNYWTSHMDSGYSLSSNHSFLASSSANITESMIADENDNKSISVCLQNYVFPGGSQNCTVDVSRCLNYNDGKMRSKNVHVEELACKDYEGSSLEEYAKGLHNF
ncbi:Holliday junction recognition protein isoform X2 [Sceloporus undulatus]|nr:Holliday junction recognition protein isoform X2 [Sceloporus undulatus]